MYVKKKNQTLETQYAIVMVSLWKKIVKKFPPEAFERTTETYLVLF